MVVKGRVGAVAAVGLSLGLVLGCGGAEGGDGESGGGGSLGPDTGASPSDDGGEDEPAEDTTGQGTSAGVGSSAGDDDDASTGAGPRPGSTGASGETSGGTSGESTGTVEEPSATVSLITDANRHYVEMHGGWGPHLRAPMMDGLGTLWFAYDGGPSVLQNTTIQYARLGRDGWSTVASQAHGAGVQQNSAHVLRGDFVMTYSVNPQQAVLEECYFDTTDYAVAACNTIAIGGPYATPPNSNYVGAALGPGGATVVWFTVVGAGGGAGQFVYTADYGGGWNGPTVTGLPGFNDYSYVRASFRAANQLAIVGEAYVGAFPDGSYTVGVSDVTLGSGVAFDVLGPGARPVEVGSPADIWVDPDHGDVHALAHAGGVVTYFHRPAGASWADHATPVATLPETYRARFLHVLGGPLVLARGSSSGAGIEVRWAERDGSPIDWGAAQSLDVALDERGFGSPSAIYAMQPHYQTVPVSELHFAVCGQYGVADGRIHHVALEL